MLGHVAELNVGALWSLVRSTFSVNCCSEPELEPLDVLLLALLLPLCWIRLQGIATSLPLEEPEADPIPLEEPEAPLALLADGSVELEVLDWPGVVLVLDDGEVELVSELVPLALELLLPGEPDDIPLNERTTN